MNNIETFADNTNEFNKILYEKLFENDDSDDDDTDKCLITMEKLDNNSIKLVCGHKFNYIPLYKELENQKIKNNLEITRTSYYQVKCPYCRTIQDGLIPYNKNFPELKLRGVNSPNSQCFKPNKCSKILKSGKRKGETCNISCYHEFCGIHNKI